MKNFFYVFLILLMTSCGGNSDNPDDIINSSKFTGQTFEMAILVNFHARPEKYGYEAVKDNVGNTNFVMKDRYLSKAGITKATGYKPENQEGFYGLYLYLDEKTEREMSVAMMRYAGHRAAFIVDGVVVTTFPIDDEGKNPAVKNNNKVLLNAQFTSAEVKAIHSAFNNK